MNALNVSIRPIPPPQAPQAETGDLLRCPKCGLKVHSSFAPMLHRLSPEQSDLYGAVVKQLLRLGGDRTDATNTGGIPGEAEPHMVTVGRLQSNNELPRITAAPLRPSGCSTTATGWPSQPAVSRLRLMSPPRNRNGRPEVLHEGNSRTGAGLGCQGGLAQSAVFRRDHRQVRPQGDPRCCLVRDHDVLSAALVELSLSRPVRAARADSSDMQPRQLRASGWLGPHAEQWLPYDFGHRRGLRSDDPGGIRRADQEKRFRQFACRHHGQCDRGQQGNGNPKTRVGRKAEIPEEADQEDQPEEGEFPADEVRQEETDKELEEKLREEWLDRLWMLFEQVATNGLKITEEEGTALAALHGTFHG